MTALADATDPRFTDGQRAHLARFEAAEVPAEVAEAGEEQLWKLGYAQMHAVFAPQAGIVPLSCDPTPSEAGK